MTTASPNRSLQRTCRSPALCLTTDHLSTAPNSRSFLLLFLTVWFAAESLRGAEALPALPRPHIIVQACHDRDPSSDLYAYDLEGKLLRRLTQKPLPTCNLAAVSPDGGQVLFVANASALYNMNVRWDSLITLHAGDAAAVAMHSGGRGVAYVARGFQKDAGRFLHVQPLVAGAPFKRLEMPLAEAAQEITFTPEANQLLLTIWSGVRAKIDSCDLQTRKVTGWLSDAKVSYSQPAFAPDGKTVTAICEDLPSGEWTIVSKKWPAGDLRVLRTAPRGVPISSPVYSTDGKRLFFFQDWVMASMPAEGGDAEGITGELDNQPRPVGFRPGPARDPSMPLLVDRWFATVEYEEPDGVLVLIDVRSKAKKRIPLPKGKLHRAVVIE